MNTCTCIYLNFHGHSTFKTLIYLHLGMQKKIKADILVFVLNIYSPVRVTVYSKQIYPVKKNVVSAIVSSHNQVPGTNIF